MKRIFKPGFDPEEYKRNLFGYNINEKYNFNPSSVPIASDVKNDYISVGVPQ